MVLDLIRKSLEHYLTVTTDENEIVEIKKHIDSCQSTFDHYENPDWWDNSVELVTVPSLTNMLNYLTYDDYGKLKKSTGSVSFEQYCNIVRTKYDLDLSPECLELGYDLIHDLWNDNEQFGYNNPDGTCG